VRLVRVQVVFVQESFREAGRIAEAEGAAGLVLHARYAEQLYAPPVHWTAIASLREQLSVPVIGNGDVYTADDAMQMMLQTHAAGVMVGRSCLGRPWVPSSLSLSAINVAAAPGPVAMYTCFIYVRYFASGICIPLPCAICVAKLPESRLRALRLARCRCKTNDVTGEAVYQVRKPSLRVTCSVTTMGFEDESLSGPQVFAEIAAAMKGLEPPAPVRLHQAVADLRAHAFSLAEWENERSAMLQIRKFVPLYLHGFRSARALQSGLLQSVTTDQFGKCVESIEWDPDELFPESSARLARLKGGTHGDTQRVRLPDGWLDDAWNYSVSDVSDIACEG
jgi:tRNA-dihydrouridine synthase